MDKEGVLYGQSKLVLALSLFKQFRAFPKTEIKRSAFPDVGIRGYSIGTLFA
jgi:hypothetical protein